MKRSGTRRASSLGLFASITIIAACDGGPSGPPPIASMEPTVDEISGQVGQSVTVQVRVTDDAGLPVAGVAVSFTQSAQGGSVSPQTTTSDAFGAASTSWTLGHKPGTQMAMAAVQGFSVAVTAAVLPGPAAQVLIASGDDQVGMVGEYLVSPVEVRVQDEFENPVGGQIVSFAVGEAGGSVELTPSGSAAGIGPAAAATASAVTEASGSTRAHWVLGTKAGVHTLEASVGALPPVVFSAVAIPAPPSEVTGLSGDGQIGTVGEAVAQTVVVEVLDPFGNPTPGEVVIFVVTEGCGTIDPGLATSDESGRAAAGWVLGSVVGENRVEARVEGLDPAVFAASSVAGPAAQLVSGPGSGQTGPVGGPLPTDIEVSVLDGFGNPVEGEAVDFVVTGGGGSLTPNSTTTDAAGSISASWTLGTTPGLNAAEARKDGFPAVTFEVQGEPAAPSEVIGISGDAQAATVGSPVSEPLIVEVRDQFGNPVSGVEVAFTPTAGGGSTAPATAGTDALGRASSVWTLGTTLALQSLEAQVDGLAPANFAASTTAGSPHGIIIVSGDAQTGLVGSTLPASFVVEVRDEFDNPVGLAPVGFQVTAGGGSMDQSTVVADESGRASANLTLGRTAGTNEVAATAEGGVSVQLTATATAGPAAIMAVHQGDGQSATVSTTVSLKPSVVVRDAFANPVEGVAVTFAVTSGGGSAVGTARTTDENGIARVGSWTLGPSAGSNTMAASSPGLAPVTFTATGTAAPPPPPPPPPPPSGYNAELRFIGTATPSQQATFNSASARWNSVVTGDLPDMSVVLPAGACGVGHPALNETIDDLVIYIELVAIDGPGRILGSAGPCVVRPSGALTVLGRIRLDQADVASMESSGTLYDVDEHVFVDARAEVDLSCPHPVPVHILEELAFLPVVEIAGDCDRLGARRLEHELDIHRPWVRSRRRARRRLDAAGTETSAQEEHHQQRSYRTQAPCEGRDREGARL